MDLKQFSKNELLKEKSFNPVLPNGDIAKDINITIRSVKSDVVLADLDRIDKDTGSMKRVDQIESDIKHAKTILVGFSGIVVGGETIKDDAKGIDFVLENFGWLRTQVILKSRDDGFFFGL